MERAIYLNDEIKSWHEANINPFNFSMMYGYGVFEGIRSYATSKGRSIFRLKDHINRLFDSAKIVNLKLVFTEDEIIQKIGCLIKEINGDNLYIRPMIYCDSDGFLGLKAKELRVDIAIAAVPWLYEPSTEQRDSGFTIITSSQKRPSLSSAYLNAKANGNYLSSIINLQDLVDTNIDDVVICDPQGFIAEASGANIFIIKNETLYTPFTYYALDGITRNTVLSLCDELNLQYQVSNLKKEDLYLADEIFLAGTAMEVMPVTKVDGRIISNGRQGNLTKEIFHSYKRIVTNQVEKYHLWHSYL